MQQFLKAATAASNVGGLWDVLVRYFDQSGIRAISYLHFGRTGTTALTQMWGRLPGFPDDLIERYEGGLWEIDPVRAEAAVQPAPFRWSQIDALRKLSPEEAAFEAEVRQYRAGDGLVVPVFGPAGRNGFVAFALREPDKEVPPDLLIEYRVVCQYFHQRYCELVPLGEGAAAVLSNREQDVLHWVARGKSNSVIADILGVSANTVDTHLRRIYHKLQVSDRVSAVLAGLGHGLITLE